MGENAGIVLTFFVGSFLKYHFVPMRLQNSLKSIRNSGLLIVCATFTGVKTLASSDAANVGNTFYLLWYTCP